MSRLQMEVAARANTATRNPGDPKSRDTLMSVVLRTKNDAASAAAVQFGGIGRRAERRCWTSAGAIGTGRPRRPGHGYALRAKRQKHLPPADTGANLLHMSTPQTQSSPSRATSDQFNNAQPEQELPATLGQKAFIVGLYVYVLSLAWLTLSHYWYSVLPNWLDPH